MDFTSRKRSHTPTRASLRREPGAIRRSASSLVCIKVFFEDSHSPLRRQRHPFAEPRREVETGHRRAHAQVSATRSIPNSLSNSIPLSRHNLAAALDPDNAGVLVVHLEGGDAAERVRDRGGVVLGADDITRRLDSRDDGCIVM
jgi:hypothetical protein